MLRQNYKRDANFKHPFEELRKCYLWYLLSSLSSTSFNSQLLCTRSKIPTVTDSLQLQCSHILFEKQAKFLLNFCCNRHLTEALKRFFEKRAALTNERYNKFTKATMLWCLQQSQSKYQILVWTAFEVIKSIAINTVDGA